jgi:Tfp pilus assembly protein PilO
MATWSETVEKLKEKYNLIHWAIMTLMFLGGLLINATYSIVGMIMVPFDNQKDITILLEKSEELSAFFESVKNVQADLQAAKANNLELKNQLDNMNIEITGHLRKLDDGQLQLFLKTERLDERTTKK